MLGRFACAALRGMALCGVARVRGMIGVAALRALAGRRQHLLAACRHGAEVFATVLVVPVSGRVLVGASTGWLLTSSRGRRAGRSRRP